MESALGFGASDLLLFFEQLNLFIDILLLSDI